MVLTDSMFAHPNGLPSARAGVPWYFVLFQRLNMQTDVSDSGFVILKIDTVCVGAAEVKTLRTPGPPGQWCSKHDYERLS